MDTMIPVPLNLPDVRVLSTQQTEPGHWLIRVESPLDGTRCRHCGREMRDLHGWDAAVHLRHLPRFDGPVLLEIRPTRYRCPDCTGHPTTTHRCEWSEPRRPNTHADEPWALRMLSNATGADAARQLGGSAETIDGLLDRWIERAVDGDAWARLGGRGLDESARPRGHRAVVTLVPVPRAEGGVEIVAVLADRKQATGAACRRPIPARLRRTSARAGTARDAGFVNALNEAIPWVKSVIDRVPVARAYRDGADTVRQQALKRLKRAVPTAEYAEITGAMWPFRQRPGALDPQEWERLARRFISSPKIEAASHLRANLTDRFARDSTKAGAKCAIRAWCKQGRRSGLAEFERVLGTIDRWMDEMTHDCQGRQTSGFVEGFKNRVKGLTRRCDGIVNVSRLCQRLTLDLHGYQRFGHT